MTCAKPPTPNLARLRFLADLITEKGLCTRPGADPDLWFPDTEPGGNATTQRRFYQQAAAARCAGCPTVEECLEVALAEEGDLLLQHGCAPHGIRAGLAPWARLNLLLASNTAGSDTEEAA
ncbi:MULTISPECIES: WhiB family transcriptional regulator [unclassified Nonomuraea]|uniref:WhiB family transcriptional regulator n=1 Tax=unclassified Nonomuraea TaxID=2593643 RepID=UPI0033CDEFEE